MLIIISTVLSSYTSPTESKINRNDSVITVKASVDVKVPKYQKTDEDVIKNATRAMDKLVTLQEDRNILTEAVLMNQLTKIEEICQQLNITPDELFKKARRDIIGQFIINLLILLLMIIGCYNIFKKTLQNQITWQNTIVLSVVFLSVLYISDKYLYQLYSFITNSNYLIIKEITNQIIN